MRLIDADALIAKLHKDPLYNLVERYGIEGFIESMPTQISPESQMKEYIPKDEVLDIIKSMPTDLVEEYIYMTKGIWLDESEGE